MKNIMRFLIIAASILIFSGCMSSAIKREKVDWKLVWNDEFEYTGLPDSSKWQTESWPPKMVNEELQLYTKDRLENCRCENGLLIIEARNDDYAGTAYTSARLITRGKGDWLYCRVEVMAKLPEARGTWPAIWMMPSNDWTYGKWPASGEIDIMEHVGYDLGKIHASTHTKACNWKINCLSTSISSVRDCAKVFHVYAMEWFPERIDIFVDDNPYFTLKNNGKGWESWPFDKSFYLILNIAVGGIWGGVQGINKAAFPQRMEVDYVRVYENPEYPMPGK